MTMKKIIISVIALVLVLGGAFYYFVGTPKYSLYQLKKAITNHDSTTFNKYVDVDRVTGNLIETASKDFDEEMKKQYNPFGSFGKGLLDAMLPALKEQMKSGINKGIEEISSDKDNKLVSVKVQDVIMEGKSAKVTLINSNNEPIKVSMIQTPERYWKIVSIDFDDFKKISPDAMKTSDAPSEDTAKTESTIIDKVVGDDIELATMKFKFNVADEKQTISTKYGSTKKAAEGTKFVVINLTATNITKESFDFETDGIKLTDDQGRKFETYEDTIGSIDNYLNVRGLQPSISETGVIVYQVPNDANSYGIDLGKRGTNEVYRVKLK